jgi:hypothetical protein
MGRQITSEFLVFEGLTGFKAHGWNFDQRQRTFEPISPSSFLRPLVFPRFFGLSLYSFLKSDLM